MKKLLVVILYGLAFLSITGCGVSATKPPAVGSNAPASTKATSNSAPDIENSELSNFDERQSEDPEELAFLKEASFDDLNRWYGADIFATAIASYDWEDASQINPDFLIEFFGNKTELYTLTTDSDPIPVPATLVEPFIKQYFNVEASQLRKSSYYNKTDSTYGLPIYSGGASSNKIVRSTLEGQILTLFYEYYSATDDTTVVLKGALKIKVDTYHYKYIFCNVEVMRE